MEKLFVIKSTGEKEEFKPEKIQRSLLRSRVPLKIVDRVVAEVGERVKPGMTTYQVLDIVYQLVNETHPHHASRFDLKRGMMLLGPTGFAFEDYTSKIFQNLGYTTETDVLVSGESGAKHEIDVIAQKGKRKLMIECKYHNYSGGRCDIKTALYVWARFLDLGTTFTEVRLVTNTKLTSEAIKYANHVGLKLLSWNHPKGAGIKDLVDDSCMYPVTVIRQLSKMTRRKLTEHKIILVKQLLEYNSRELAQLLQVPVSRVMWLQNLAKGICES